MKFFEKLERKYGRYAIRDLMRYIIILYIIGWAIEIVNEKFYVEMLAMDVEKILHGQVWRLFTFIIMPPQDSSYIFMVFTLYLYYVLGTSLERVWGAFRFNAYFFMGVIFHIIAAFLIYFIFGDNMMLTTYYLNMSLFFAFACIYPDMELLLFFVLPIKIKWLAILDGIYFLMTIISGFMWYALPNNAAWKFIEISYKFGVLSTPDVAVAALVSILNFVIFFFMTRNYRKIAPKEIKRKHNYKKQVKQTRADTLIHKCAICGRTSETNPELSFRFCSKCAGNHEYCNEHLFSHEHVK